MSAKPLLFTTGNCDELKSRMLATGQFDEGSLYRKPFPDGEIYHRLDSSVFQREVVLLGSDENCDTFLDLYDVANLLADEGAVNLKIVLPKVKSKRRKNAAFEKRLRSRILSSIQATPCGNQLVSVDNGPLGTSLNYITKKIKAHAPIAAGDAAIAYNPFKSNEKQILFASRSYGDLQRELLALGNFEEGSFETDATRSNQPATRVVNNVAGQHVVLICGSIDNEETIDIIRRATLLKEAGALSLTIVMAYYGYSTMERKVKGLEAVKADYRARLFGRAIPQCPLGNTIACMDLHADGTLGVLKANGLRADHIYCSKHLVEGRLTAEPGLITRLAGTDTGRAKWVNSVAKDFGLTPVFSFSFRVSGTEKDLIGMVGDVTGQHVGMYDDMGRTMGSAKEAGVACQAKGARSLELILTHGPIVGDSLDKLKGIFTRVTVTNTHPKVIALQNSGKYAGYLFVESCASRVINYLNNRG